ncbi:6-hydroxymethylpterin diphosphokinase MptE-like protein [Halosegnis marinus]|uniref:6-hydroxymethyl-7,8-dihydropterin pyrophosphokinase n=1 Tax=Halosegnis marinus TaxID=3034023 RepID=A0ABD5ZSA7_9EURY|nr:6-hydroxymethylpterin diphosphokinase MptE-like protein [Halosegnis sp. DT85]
MRWETWEPVYRLVLDDFGFPAADDERARDVLADLAAPFDHRRLAGIEGADVAVCGGAATLADGLDRVRAADYVVAASVAADTLREHRLDVDLMVTDLDKNPDTARHLTREGVVVAAHAHGDNIDLVRQRVPGFDGEYVLPTVQCEPAGPTENFGGFTDGDRAAFLADHFGAASLTFPGWDFDDPGVSPAKRRKLDWAARLLRWLETRREERFDVLDGRRDGLDPL